MLLACVGNDGRNRVWAPRVQVLIREQLWRGAWPQPIGRNTCWRAVTYHPTSLWRISSWLVRLVLETNNSASDGPRDSDLAFLWAPTAGQDVAHPVGSKHWRCIPQYRSRDSRAAVPHYECISCRESVSRLQGKRGRSIDVPLDCAIAANSASSPCVAGIRGSLFITH